MGQLDMIDLAVAEQSGQGRPRLLTKLGLGKGLCRDYRAVMLEKDLVDLVEVVSTSLKNRIWENVALGQIDKAKFVVVGGA